MGTGVGTGYVKRYSLDACAATEPPPYYPITNHFTKAQLYQVGPLGFSAAVYFEMLAPQNIGTAPNQALGNASFIARHPPVP